MEKMKRLGVSSQVPLGNLKLGEGNISVASSASVQSKVGKVGNTITAKCLAFSTQWAELDRLWAIRLLPTVEFLLSAKYKF